jgi:hypothetical protein
MPFSRCVPAVVALILAITPLSDASAQVITNVLLDWRAQLDLCEGSDQRDRGALLHVAMFEAINATSGTPYRPYTQQIRAEEGSSTDAAAAQAAHDILTTVCPGQQAGFASALQKSLENIADSTARARGAAVGQQAAAQLLAVRAAAQANTKDPYYATETPGLYVPTLRRVGVALTTQAPWIMTSPGELRSPPPPALTSERYARDLAEIARLGGKGSTERTAVQTDMAQFWATRDVRLVLRQLIGTPGRTLLQDARFLALAEMAWADSYVSMMDGKYAYNLWRPVTAIRGAATDGNDATVAEPEWEPLLPTPGHPEYPCGHCLSAGAVGTVIAEEFGDRMPEIVLEVESTMLRRYTRAQDYIDEVTESRLLVGVHYRFSLDAGRTAGVSLGRLAGQRRFPRRE